MSNIILSLVRADLQNMMPYHSARNITVKGEIWLNANESPWDDTGYNRYPQKKLFKLTRQLSAIYRVDENQILVTRGSDEGIDLLIRLFCDARLDDIMICPPTYGMYKVAAMLQAAGIKEVPLDQDFQLNTEEILKKWGSNTKLIFICSPNNPTGNLLSREAIKKLLTALQGRGMVVVDEAYIEFSEANSMVTMLNEHANLIILRTLSKAYGFAGLRCGATLAHESMISLLNKMIAPYPLASNIETMILENLNLALVESRIKILREEKAHVIKALSNVSIIKKIWRSDANFILMKVHDKNKILALCLRHGIVLREIADVNELNNMIRMTIGTPEENRKVIEVFKNA